MADHGFRKALPDLVAQGLITADQAERIRAHYSPTDDQRSGRQTLLFSVLGGLLIGLGVVLVVAHNWDDLGTTLQTVLAFLPMALGQVLCAWVLLKGEASAGWREGSALFLSGAVAAAIALVAQIHHIPGDLGRFLLTWSVLLLGVVYALRSFTTALLMLVLLTWYAGVDRFGEHLFGDRPWAYLVLLAALLPFLWGWLRDHTRSVSTFWLALLSALSMAYVSQLFLTWRDLSAWSLMYPTALAGAFTLVPVLASERGERLRAFRGVGITGLLLVLFFFSWSDLWKEVVDEQLPAADVAPLGVALALYGAAYLAARRLRRPFSGILFPEVPLIFLPIVVIATFSPGFAAVLVNLLLLALGILTTRRGIAEGSLLGMNTGLFILAVTIAMRFLDLELSYALRGLLFIGIGALFLGMNLWLVRQRRSRHA